MPRRSRALATKEGGIGQRPRTPLQTLRVADVKDRREERRHRRKTRWGPGTPGIPSAAARIATPGATVPQMYAALNDQLSPRQRRVFAARFEQQQARHVQTRSEKIATGLGLAMLPVGGWEAGVGATLAKTLGGRLLRQAATKPIRSLTVGTAAAHATGHLDLPKPKPVRPGQRQTREAGIPIPGVPEWGDRAAKAALDIGLYSGPSLYEGGKAGVQDTASAIRGDRSFKRSRKYGKEVGRSIAHGATHPTEPESFAQNLLLLLGAGNLLAHGVERGAGAAKAPSPRAALTRKGHEGGSLLHTRAPGETTLRQGGLEVQRIEPDAPLLRPAHRARTRWLNWRLANPDAAINRMAPGRAENVLVREKQAGDRISTSVEAGLASALRRHASKLSANEHTASGLIAIEGKHALDNPGEVVARHAATHRKWAEEGIEPEVNLEAARDIEAALPALQDPSKNLLRAIMAGYRLSERSEGQQIRRGLVDPVGAQVRKASIAELFGRGHPAFETVTRSRSAGEARARLKALDARYDELVTKVAAQVDPMVGGKLAGGRSVKQIETTYRNRSRNKLRGGIRRGNMPTVTADIRELAETEIARRVEENPGLPAAQLLREREQLRERLNNLSEAAISGERAPGHREALKALYGHAREVQPHFEDLLAGIAEKTGARLVPGELKKGRRALEKVKGEYGGDASRLKDVVRARFVVDSPAELEAVVAELKATGRVAGQKNSLARPIDSGYRDLKLYLDIDGHLSEAAIVPREIDIVRKRLKPTYDRWRKMPPGPKEAAIAAEMSARYAEALDAWVARSSSNSARSIGVHSPRADQGKGRPPGRSQAVATPPSIETGIPSYSSSFTSALAPLLEEVPTTRSLLQSRVPSLGHVDERQLIHPSGPGLGIAKPPEGSFYFPTGEHFKLKAGAPAEVRGSEARRPRFSVGPVAAGRGQHGALRSFTGEGMKHGRVQRPLEAIAEAHAGRQVGYSATDFYRDLLRTSTATKANEFQVGIRRTARITRAMRRELAAAAEKARSGDQTALVRAFEKMHGEIVLPGSEAAAVGMEIPGVRWVDVAHFRPTRSAPSQGPLAAVARAVNRPARFLGVYARPGYWATNRPGNEAMGIFQHGPKAFSVGTAARIRRLGDEESGAAEAVAGTSRTESYRMGAQRSRAYAGKNPVGKALGQTGRAADALERRIVGTVTGLTDRSFRLRMFEIRAAQRGYHGKDRLRELLMSEDPKVRADLIAAARRSRRDAVDFDSLAPHERQLAEAFYFYPWTSRAFAWTGRFAANRPLTAGTIAAAAPVARERQPDWLKKGPSWLRGYVATPGGRVVNLGGVATPATPAQTLRSAGEVGKGLAGVGKPGHQTSFSREFGTPILQLAGGETAGGLLGTSGAGALLRRGGIVKSPAIVGRPGKAFPETGWRAAAGSFLYGGLFPRKPDRAYLREQWLRDQPPVRRAVLRVYDERQQIFGEAKRLGLLTTKDGKLPRKLRRAYTVEAQRQAAYAKASAGVEPGTRDYQAARFEADVAFLERFKAIDAAAAAKGRAKAKSASRDELKSYRDYIRNHFYKPGFMDTIAEARKALKKAGGKVD